MNDERETLHRHVALLKVIADETRLRILGLLADRDHTGKELAEVLVGSDAPTEIPVHRQEVYEAIKRENSGTIGHKVAKTPPATGKGAAPSEGRKS